MNRGLRSQAAVTLSALYLVTVLILSPVWTLTTNPPLLLYNEEYQIEADRRQSSNLTVLPGPSQIQDSDALVSKLQDLLRGKEESRTETKPESVDDLFKNLGLKVARENNGIILVRPTHIISNVTKTKEQESNLSTSDLEDEEIFNSGCNITEVEDLEENITVKGVAVKCENVSVLKIAPLIPNNTLYFEVHNCSNGNEFALYTPLFSNLTQLKALSFIDCNVRLTSKFFIGLKNLKNITITKNMALRVLLPYMFQHVDQLEVVEFSYCSFLKMSYVFQAVSKLKNLRVLILEGLAQSTKKHYKIHVKELAGNTNLEELILTTNNIAAVEVGAFRYLDKLRVLDLSENPLSETEIERITNDLQNSRIETLVLRKMGFLGSTVPTKALSYLSNSTIRKLDLRFNMFFTLEEGSFPYLPQLQILRLDECGILFFDAGSLSSVPNLTSLSLRGNKLSSNGNSIYYLENLRSLDMREMRPDDERSVFSITPNSLSNLTSLEELTFTNTRLHSVVTQPMFYGLVSLKRLSMHNCFIQTIEQNAFSTLRSLELLILSGNVISLLDPGVFFGLSKLKDLFLHNNFLTLEEERQPFKYLTSLKILFLHHNSIAKLDPETFIHLKELEMLAISSNKISSWRKRMFMDNRKLRRLRLDYNQIEVITDAMIKDFDQLQELNLVFNPLNCLSCEMKQFQEWIQSETTNVTLIAKDDISLGGYLCKSPKKFENVYFLDARIPDNYCDEISSVLPIVIAINSASLSVLIILIGMLCYLRWYIRYAWFLIKVGTKRFRDEVTENDYVYDAFVSYSPDDQNWVREKLLPALENYDDGRLKLCVHDRDFEAGKVVTDNILESIDKSRKTILILSDSFVTSEWCMFEVQMAEHKLFEERKESLILVCLSELDNKKLSRHLKYLIKTRTFIPWTTNSVGQKLFWERLKFSVVKPSDRYKLPRIT